MIHCWFYRCVYPFYRKYMAYLKKHSPVVSSHFVAGCSYLNLICLWISDDTMYRRSISIFLYGCHKYQRRNGNFMWIFLDYLNFNYLTGHGWSERPTQVTLLADVKCVLLDDKCVFALFVSEKNPISNKRQLSDNID